MHLWSNWAVNSEWLIFLFPKHHTSIRDGSTWRNVEFKGFCLNAAQQRAAEICQYFESDVATKLSAALQPLVIASGRVSHFICVCVSCCIFKLHLNLQRDTLVLSNDWGCYFSACFVHCSAAARAQISTNNAIFSEWRKDVQFSRECVLLRCMHVLVAIAGKW